MVIWDTHINSKHINHYRSKLRGNKDEYSMDARLYKTKNYVKVAFITKEFSSSKNIAHWFNIDNMKVDEGIGYEMIIGCDLMV